MSFERENEALGSYSALHGHSLQQMYNSSSGAPLNLQRPTTRNGSPVPPSVSSPTVGGGQQQQGQGQGNGGYPSFAMYPNNSFARFPVSMNVSQQQQQQQATPNSTTTPISTTQQNTSLGSTTATTVPTSTTATTTAEMAQLAGNSTHVARQLTYAQISRQSASPHHHARTAAAMARNAPVASTVTITDPNNPSKSFNGIMSGGGIGSGGVNNKSINSRDEEVNGRTSNNNKLPNNNSIQQQQQQQTWTTLDMGGMGLKNLSPTLCNTYTFLTTLYLNYNNLTYLPSSINALTHLKTLDVSGNKLTSIPPELGLLIQLRELLLFDNNITDLPSELGSLYQLETLGLEGNPIQPDIKNTLLKDGSAAVILSLRENAPGKTKTKQKKERIIFNIVICILLLTMALLLLFFFLFLKKSGYATTST